jgi:hypothetical protein
MLLVAGVVENDRDFGLSVENKETLLFEDEQDDSVRLAQQH